VAALSLALVGCSIVILDPLRGIQGEEHEAMALAARVAQVTEPDALVAIVEPGDDPRRGEWFQYQLAPGQYLGYMPIRLYLSHRKGWSVDAKDVTLALVQRLHQRGARYLVSSIPAALGQDPALRAWLSSTQTLVEETPSWAIYRLQ
jgi:hypothetical protein